MGSGSFGGGSGSFSGGSGAGSISSRSTDSAHERILSLTKLTDSVNANPDIAGMRATVYRLLQDRTRSAFFRAMLSDDAVVSAFRGLLLLEAELRAGAALPDAATKFNVPSNAALADVADKITLQGQSPNTDERIEAIARRAVTDVLLRTVQNEQDLYYDTPLEELSTKFDRGLLRNTADIFLGLLMSEAVRRDLLDLSADARVTLVDASREIAATWIDKFRERNKAAGFLDMMQGISTDYAAYSGGKHE